MYRANLAAAFFAHFYWVSSDPSVGGGEIRLTELGQIGDPKVILIAFGDASRSTKTP